MLTFKATVTDAGKRADVSVAKKLPEFTRSSLSGLFDKHLVLINGKSAKASYKLHVGDKLEVETDLLTAQPEKIELPVIYEDDNVIVINKPAGVLTHSKGALNTEATVASWLREYVLKNTPKEALDYGLWTMDSRQSRAGIVHRLDRATSGVIITAKDEKTQKWLQKQFSTRKVKKTYLAIVEGVPEPQQAIIDAPIERNLKKPQTFRVGSTGREAQTEYRVIKVLDLSRTLALVELKPLTGRTHQLRVHLKYIGHPIVGDRVYGRAGSPVKISTNFQAGKHLYLHAKSLELTLPGGNRQTFKAPEPDYFIELAKP